MFGQATQKENSAVAKNNKTSNSHKQYKSRLDTPKKESYNQGAMFGEKWGNRHTYRQSFFSQP